MKVNRHAVLRSVTQEYAATLFYCETLTQTPIDMRANILQILLIQIFCLVYLNEQYNCVALLLRQHVFFLQKTLPNSWENVSFVCLFNTSLGSKSTIFSTDIHDHQWIIPANCVCSSPIFNSWISVTVQLSSQDVFVVWCFQRMNHKDLLTFYACT